MFDRLKGNREVKDLFRRMLTKGRVANALIFIGEEGVGKKAFAVELAAALNCRARTPSGEACNECSACERIMRWPTEEKVDKQIVWSAHPDVGLIQPAGRHIVAEQARELAREANSAPYEGLVRFFIIDEADKLNDTAAGALLKTLEEMPTTTHIALITDRPAALLPTVVSRCQQVRFAPIPTEELAAAIADEKGVGMHEARTIAEIARGSWGRAMRLDWERERAHAQRALAIIEAAAARDRARLLRLAEELSDATRKEEFEPTLDWLPRCLRAIFGCCSVRLKRALSTATCRRVWSNSRNKYLPLAQRGGSRRSKRCAAALMSTSTAASRQMRCCSPWPRVDRTINDASRHL
ncbi:MAG: hypothetical protein C4334_00510 [Pyrinomonas sp.]|uniref:DNA polymerase III subunit n=1 Tax=Pyrinomonas sp. TaxID=2080306 RepID=UPI003333C4A8